MSETESLGTRPVRRHGRRRSGWLVFLRDLVVILVVAFLVSFLLKTFLIRSFYIPSSSMEDTLQVNDRIIVNELVPKVMPVQYGDVVVFKDPGGWLTPSAHQGSNWFVDAGDWLLSLIGLSTADADDHLIKRVIGLPGDEVACCTASGDLTVNGVPLDEPYLKIAPGQDSAPAAFDVTVPANSLWVMGDNRFNSRDSLGHIDDPGGGFVPMDDLVGKALVISWPISRWRVLDNYPLTFAGVAEARGSSALAAASP